MPAILICDAPGCEARSPFSVSPSGRYSHAPGWWVVRKHEAIVIACCQDHLVVASEAVLTEAVAPTPASTS